MSIRPGRHLRRTADEHTTWCARDHRCNLGEHRSDEMLVDLAGAGRVVVTRVRAGDREYAEIRGRIRLHDTEAGARWQLNRALSGLRQLLAAVRLLPGTTPAPTPALGVDKTPALADASHEYRVESGTTDTGRVRPARAHYWEFRACDDAAAVRMATGYARSQHGPGVQSRVYRKMFLGWVPVGELVNPGRVSAMAEIGH